MSNVQGTPPPAPPAMSAARVIRYLPLFDGKKHRHGGQEAKADINITPLVDVVLVLLIIFMVVTPLLERAIKLPEVDQPDAWKTGEEDLNVAIDKTGKVMVDTDTVSVEMLPQKLAQALSRNVNRQIYLEIDRSVKFGTVRPVLKALADSGASNVGLGSAPQKK